MHSSLSAHHGLQKWNHRWSQSHRAGTFLLSASIQGTCSVSLSMIFWVRLQVANRLDLRFVYIWVIWVWFLQVVSTISGLIFGTFQTRCKVWWRTSKQGAALELCDQLLNQRPGVAVFRTSKALSSHCSLARCFRCALRRRFFQHGQLCWSIEASKWSLKLYAKL